MADSNEEPGGQTDDDDDNLVSIINEDYERAEPKNKLLYVAAKPFGLTYGLVRNIAYLILFIGLALVAFFVLGPLAMAAWIIGTSLAGIGLGTHPDLTEFGVMGRGQLLWFSDTVSFTISNALLAYLWDLFMFTLTFLTVFAVLIAVCEVAIRIADRVRDGDPIGYIAATASYGLLAAGLARAGSWHFSNYPSDDPIAHEIGYALYILSGLLVVLILLMFGGAYQIKRSETTGSTSAS